MWGNITEKESRETLEALASSGIIRKINQDNWKVLVDRLVPKDQNIARNYGREIREQRMKLKSGVCPGCGKNVRYKNRHARSGTLHSGDDCSINKIKTIMEG